MNTDKIATEEQEIFAHEEFLTKEINIAHDKMEAGKTNFHSSSDAKAIIEGRKKSRKQVVAIEALREAIQGCERAGMPVWAGKKMITGAMIDKDGVKLV